MQLFATWCLLGQVFLAAAAPQKPAASQGIIAKPSNASSPSVGHAGSNSSVSAPAAPPPKRARLDVGFASFEKDMMDQILVSIRNGTANNHWSNELQMACKNNVTEALSQGLKSQLAPLKQTIGKTWMSLPEDEQKNGYVDQLRSAYEPVFKDVMGTIGSHLERSLKRLQTHAYTGSKKALSQDQLIAECASSITGNLIMERCYDVGGEQHMKKVSSFLEVKKGDAPKNFCMKSVIEALITRLKDSQGLIGMTMQFEAKSETLSASPTAIDDLVKSVR